MFYIISRTYFGPSQQVSNTLEISTQAPIDVWGNEIIKDRCETNDDWQVLVLYSCTTVEEATVFIHVFDSDYTLSGSQAGKTIYTYTPRKTI